MRDFPLKEEENWKIQALPLARIKKIMKSEDFAMQELEKARRIKSREPLEGEGAKPTTKFMIAAEAPLVMTKACELMVKELSLRAWRHTDNNRRKTLQRADVHAAVGESEIFDFLIDLVPRVTPSDSMRVNVGAQEAAASVPSGPEVSPPTNRDPPAQSAGMAAAAHASAQHQQQHAPQLDLVDPASLLMGPDLTQNLQHPPPFFHVNNPTAGNTDETENASAPQEEEQQQDEQQQSASAHLWGEKSTEG